MLTVGGVREVLGRGRAVPVGGGGLAEWWRSIAPPNCSVWLRVPMVLPVPGVK